MELCCMILVEGTLIITWSCSGSPEPTSNLSSSSSPYTNDCVAESNFPRARSYILDWVFFRADLVRALRLNTVWVWCLIASIFSSSWICSFNLFSKLDWDGNCCKSFSPFGERRNFYEPMSDRLLSPIRRIGLGASSWPDPPLYNVVPSPCLRSIVELRLVILSLVWFISEGLPDNLYYVSILSRSGLDTAGEIKGVGIVVCFPVMPRLY